MGHGRTVPMDGTPRHPTHRHTALRVVKFFPSAVCHLCECQSAVKERKRTAREFLRKRKKTDNPREGWEDGTPPPHKGF